MNGSEKFSGATGDPKDSVKQFLRQYLESRGVDITPSGHFLCPNPNHNDTGPSAHLVPESNDTYWVCFGCGGSGDLFSAAHWLEGLPLHGKEFFTGNVKVLADRFGVPYDPPEMTEQDIYLMQLRKLYQQAADTLAEFHGNRKLLDERGWSSQLCYDMRVGVVSSWQEFRSRLMAKGNYTVRHLEESGIYETLFNPFCITFTLFDEYGRPCGFSARDTRWGKVQNTKKFRMTESRIPIFRKASILHGFHLVRSKPVQLTVVEGLPDVMTALEHKMEGFVGLCTSRFTDEQVALLQKYEKNDLVLVNDFDAESGGGQLAMEASLDEVLSGRRNLRIKVIDLAEVAGEESLDPDDFIRRQSEPRTAWNALPRLDAFEWRLSRMDDQPVEVVTEKMLRIILNEPTRVRQEIMLNQLADFTGVRIEALQADLDAHLYETDRRRRDQAKDIADDVQKKLRYANPVKADALFEEGARKIKELRRETNAIVTVHTALELVDNLQDKFLSRKPGLAGWKTGWKIYDKRMGGVPKEDCFMILGGIPHSGKTSWYCDMAWRLISNNDDICVLIATIDDSCGQVYPKLVSIETGIPITHVAHPMEYLPDRVEAWQKGWTRVKNAIKAGKLDMRDSTFGQSPEYMSSWVESKKKEFKDRNIVLILDNFHKLAESTPSETMRIRFVKASEALKNLSQSGRVTIMATAELTKGIDRKNPTLGDLMETGKLEFDATIAGICHNDLQVDPGSDMYWIDDTEDTIDHTRRVKPIVEIQIMKNKSMDGAFKGAHWFKFDAKRSLFHEMAPSAPQDREDSQGSYGV